jgi:hypothetical protein
MGTKFLICFNLEKYLLHTRIQNPTWYTLKKKKNVIRNTYHTNNIRDSYY